MSWKRPRDGFARADGRIHVVEEVGWVRGVERRSLARVDDRATAERHVPIEPSFTREGGGSTERGVGRLDVNLAVDLEVDPRLAERRTHALGMLEHRDARIGEERDALAPESTNRLSDLGERPVAENDA